MMALLFLWVAGWLSLQASAPEAEGGRARGAGDRHSTDLADTNRRRPSVTSQTAAPPANAGNPPASAPAAKSAIVTTTSRKQAKLRRVEEPAAEPAAEADATMRAGSSARKKPAIDRH